MTQKSDRGRPRGAVEPRRLVAAVEAALAELQQGIPGGLSPLEQVLEERVRLAARRLLDCADQLAGAELIVPGSTGQLRPHPLLALERELRGEISEGLQKLVFVAQSRAMIERVNGLTRANEPKQRAAPKAAKPPRPSRRQP
jgi:hypothetical protein